MATEVQQTTRFGMTPRERWRLAQTMRRSATLLALPAHPATWPDWMTARKREQMAAAFREGAADIEPRRPQV